MLEEMRKAGLSDAFVGKTIGMTTQGVYRIRTKFGSRTSYENGKAISDLHGKFKAGKVKLIPASIQIKD